MPRGFGGIRQATAEIEAKRNSGGGNFFKADYFKLDNGESATVRFLEEGDEVAWRWVHDVQSEKRRYPDKIPCLDQNDEDEPCPGCEKELKRSMQGAINLIWFDGPVFKRDKDGKLVKDSDGDKIQVGEKDGVFLWTSGPRVFDELADIDETFKGLGSRIFIVKRKGERLDTKYSVKPEDVDSGKQPLSKSEKELAKEAYDTNEFFKDLDYEEFTALIEGDTSAFKKKNKDGDGDTKKAAKNPFKGRKADDDDDDDEAPAKRRKRRRVS